jgi:hypothetical protein
LEVNNLFQNIKNFFANASAWGASLPQYISVPLIIVLAAIGTAAIVSLLLLIIRLVFGQKAIDFIKNLPQRINEASRRNEHG